MAVPKGASIRDLDPALGETVFYPMCLTQMSIRLEEWGDPLTGKASVPGIGTMDLSTGTVTKSDSAVGEKLSDDLVARYMAQPIRYNVSLNSYKMADTFEAEFDLKDAPFLPPMVRGAQINGFLWSMNPELDADNWFNGTQVSIGSDRVTRALQEAFGVTANVGGEAIPRTPSALAFLGFVDEWELKAADPNNPDRITVKGRDATGLLLDTDVVSFKELKVEASMKTVLAKALTVHGQGGIDIIILDDQGNDAGEGPPRMSKTLAEAIESDGKVPDGSGKPTEQTARPATFPVSHTKYKLWDFVVQICNLAGFVPNVEVIPEGGAKYKIAIVVRQAAGIYGSDKVQKQDAPRLTYGRNIKSFTMSRKFGRVQATPVRVVSYSAKTKHVIAALMAAGMSGPVAVTILAEKGKTLLPGNAQIFEELFNKAVADRKIPTPSSIKGEQPPAIQPGEVFILNGVTDPEVLKNYARMVYDLYGTQEIGGTITTDNMRTFSSNGNDVSLLGLKSGDVIEIDFQSVPVQTHLAKVIPLGQAIASVGMLGMVSNMGQIVGSDEAEQIEYLTARGIPAEAAAPLVSTLLDYRFPTKFFARNVNHNFDKDEGYSLSIDYINTIEVRGIPR